MTKANRAYGLAGRARERQGARDRDAADIVSGARTEAEVARRNNLFADFDVKSFRISATGGKPIEEMRSGEAPGDEAGFRSSFPKR